MLVELLSLWMWISVPRSQWSKEGTHTCPGVWIVFSQPPRGSMVPWSLFPRRPRSVDLQSVSGLPPSPHPQVGAIFDCTCTSSKSEYASGECFKWPGVVCRHTLRHSHRADSSPSCTTRHSVCVKHPELAAPRRSVAFILLPALSLQMTWTLLSLQPQRRHWMHLLRVSQQAALLKAAQLSAKSNSSQTRVKLSSQTLYRTPVTLSQLQMSVVKKVQLHFPIVERWTRSPVTSVRDTVTSYQIWCTLVSVTGVTGGSKCTKAQTYIFWSSKQNELEWHHLGLGALWSCSVSRNDGCHGFMMLLQMFYWVCRSEMSSFDPLYSSRLLHLQVSPHSCTCLQLSQIHQNTGTW